MAALQTLFEVAPVVGKAAQVTITGYTDPTGSDAINRRLSQQRAEYVLRLLRDHGLEPTSFTAVGSPVPDPALLGETESEPRSPRKATLRVTLTERGSRSPG